MNQLRFIVNCDWGLSLLYAWQQHQQGNNAPLAEVQQQDAAIKALGYKVYHRIYVESISIDAPMEVFWSGHGVIDDCQRPTVREIINFADKHGVSVMPCVSDFVGDNRTYNAVRHGVSQEDINRVWDQLCRMAPIRFGNIDNEPFDGIAAYAVEDFETRARREAYHLERLGIQPIAHHRVNVEWRDAHLAIGKDNEWPPLRLPALTENWLRPGVPFSQYGELVRRANAGQVRLLGVNFGASFIPVAGLVWLGRRFQTFLWDRGGMTQAGLSVMEALGATEPQPPEPPQPQPEDPLTQKEINKRIKAREGELDRVQQRIADNDGNLPRLRGRRQEIVDELNWLEEATN